MDGKPDRTEALALAHVYYSSARQEIIARLAQRDQALTLYLAAAGVIGGAAVADLNSRWPALFVLPFLAAGAAFVLTQHNDVIGALGHFLARELGGWVRDVLADAPPQWDGSSALAELTHGPFIGRRVGQLVLVPGTASAALVAAVASGIDNHFNVLGLVVATVAGVVAVALSAVAIERSYQGRIRHRFNVPPERETSSDPT